MNDALHFGVIPQTPVHVVSRLSLSLTPYAYLLTVASCLDVALRNYLTKY